MTVISINNQQIDKSITHSATVNDVINAVLSDVVEKQGIITSIKLDGNEIEYDQEADILVSPIEHHQNIDFTVQSSIELARSALDSCAKYVDVINDKIHALVGTYNQNKINAANAQFAEVIEIIDLFIQLMTKINTTLRQSSH
ncbi:MAG: hypothetical protein WCG27_12045, partial [Pseudomonadota bacterium]